MLVFTMMFFALIFVLSGVKTLKEWENITEILQEHSPYPGRDVGEKL